MTSKTDRRSVLALMAGAALLAASPARALTEAEANGLIQQVVSEINKVINSGRSEQAMFPEFERIFRRYGDVPTIARGAMGADYRRASSGQQQAFADAFAQFLSRKYGRRFREFIGGEIIVKGTRDTGKYFEVISTTRLSGQAPFEVVFRVLERSGRPQFFDIVIEGISLVKTERVEIGALLDRNRGNIDAMIADLRASS